MLHFRLILIILKKDWILRPYRKILFQSYDLQRARLLFCFHKKSFDIFFWQENTNKTGNKTNKQEQYIYQSKSIINLIPSGICQICINKFCQRKSAPYQLKQTAFHHKLLFFLILDTYCIFGKTITGHLYNVEYIIK